mmetsp:Transcript_74585/g.103672  ORF Transcript_74585/g.103672 Transcript_74585/m.103672 type:complete len:225 (-) Transcript_74585:337-1011(-)
MTLRNSCCSILRALFSASGLCTACMDRSFSFSSSTLSSSACLSSSHRSRSSCTKATMESTDMWPFFAAASAARFSPTSKASARQFIEDASLFLPIEDVSLPAPFSMSSSSPPGVSNAWSCPSKVIRLALRGFMSLPSLRDGRRDIGGESELSLATSLAAALTTVEVAGVSASSSGVTKHAGVSAPPMPPMEVVHRLLSGRRMGRSSCEPVPNHCADFAAFSDSG